MNVETLKKKFDDLFKTPSELINHYAKRGYWITKETKCNAIMYIGLNPSYPHLDYQMSEKLFYDEIEQTHHSYYKQIDRFHNSLKCGMGWTHFDLLILRETKQFEIIKLIKNPDVREFVKKNLELSMSVIENSKPKIIVVLNTLSKKLLTEPKWCGYPLDWDDEIGTYRFSKRSAISGTPVFFSSMISGQRALDIGSRERLSWQISKTLQMMGEKNNKSQK